MTVQDLINAALRRIGALAAGETPSAEESADAFACLNRMVDSWQAERLTVYTLTRTLWTISANDGSYTLGTSGDIAIARPMWVSRIKVVDTSYTPDLEIDLGDLLTEEAYAAIGQKLLTATYPFCVYYNPTYPLGTVTFYPVPTSTTLQGALYAFAPVAQFSATSATISLPPGYERALTANLALELIPEYPMLGSTSPELRRQAEDAKGVLKLANYRPVLLTPDPALTGSRGSYNIETDRPT
jgi:hypothetical protein